MTHPGRRPSPSPKQHSVLTILTPSRFQNLPSLLASATTQWQLSLVPGLISWPPGLISSPPVSTLTPQPSFPRVNMTSPPRALLFRSSWYRQDQVQAPQPSMQIFYYTTLPTSILPQAPAIGFAKYTHGWWNIPFLNSLPPCLYCSFAWKALPWLPGPQVHTFSQVENFPCPYVPFPPQVNSVTFSVNWADSHITAIKTFLAFTCLQIFLFLSSDYKLSEGRGCIVLGMNMKTCWIEIEKYTHGSLPQISSCVDEQTLLDLFLSDTVYGNGS